MEKGIIFDIQHFCVDDGPGIRTTVFLKGCPLRCVWCHNAEGLSAQPQLYYTAGSCTGCGQCEAACAQKAHRIGADGHTIDRSACTACGACAKVCPNGALRLAGRPMTTEEVLAEVAKDIPFYRNSGGGMTLSGGEPMFQPEFARCLLTLAKQKGLHTCMETCGYAAWEDYASVLPLVDLFLFDYKLTDPQLHRQYTGVSQTRILENLFKLDAQGAKTVLRCPIIPTVNDTPDHFAGIAATANRLRNVQEIHIEPYHPLGSSKSDLLGKTYGLPELGFPENETVESWIAQVQAMTAIPVKKG